MEYAVDPVGHEMEQSYPPEGFQMVSNGTHLFRLILLAENLYCFIWGNILSGLSTQMERALCEISF